MALSQPTLDRLSALPSELLDAIFTSLPTQDLVQLRGVNQRLNSEIHSSASILSKRIIARENSRIDGAMTSRPSFEGLSLIDALKLYTSVVGLPSVSPVDIDLHSRRLASWYQTSNAKHARGVAAIAWKRTASEVFATYFYLHHAFHQTAALQDQISSRQRRFVAPSTMPRLRQLRDEAWSAAQIQDLKRCTLLRTITSADNSNQMASPWQQPDALDAAFETLQRTPLTGLTVPAAEQEAAELRRISARVAVARSSGSSCMFDTSVSGNPTAALDWALVQKAGLPVPGVDFWFAPRASARTEFENAIVRVRDFKRDPLLVAAVWESVDLRPI